MNDVNETVKDRLTRFLRAEGISKSEFARRMGLSTAYIGAMRKSMPEDKVLRMMELFPRLNRDWLLYGEGDMYREIRPGAAARLPSIDSHIVPLLPGRGFRRQPSDVFSRRGALAMRESGVAGEGSRLRNPRVGRQHGAGNHERVHSLHKENQRPGHNPLGGIPW